MVSADDEKLDREERTVLEVNGVQLRRKGSLKARVIGQRESIDLNDPAAWPETIREFAFELWMQTGRFLAATYTKLREEYRTPVPRHVLEDWRLRYDWEHEADMRLTVMYPILSTRTDLNIAFAAEAGSRYLIGVNTGALKADPARTAAARIAIDSAGKNKAMARGTPDDGMHGRVAPPPVNHAPLSDRERESITRRIAHLGLGEGPEDGSSISEEIAIPARLPDGVDGS